ncbi:DNA-binding transcriptional regulator, XRE-family HTH domain [Micromonospora citrea]|uniref:DNA-binding transcriptional regulator, XRE-family HTH domain n=1 Tax=Micromonospora citrea TaxID=47855 RepID=A0A1C6U503_9ACTN|nr:helix-turn-helix transcriptional regulator [Micromonospora citrea]SCL49074.1 DNA-binding transcriptional regulator, XRE-family HTH domain [Micromonospora citrea]
MEENPSSPHNFGNELRRLRLESGYSLSDLAREINYTKGHLSKIESGHKRPSLEMARLCDAFFAADGTLLRLVSARRAPEAGDTAGADRRDEGLTIHTRPDGSGEFHAVSRRALLASGTVAMMSWTARPVAAAPPAAVLQDGFDAYRRQLTNLRALGQTSPPAEVFPQAAAVVSALRGRAVRASGTERAQALFLAARFAEYAGWMAQENGDDTTSTWWTALAVELAEAGDDPEMAGYALVRAAEIALYRQDAIGVLDAGQAALARPAGARVRAFALQRIAQGHALAGDEVRCLRALDQAEELVDPIGVEAVAGPPLGTSTVHNPIPFVRGWCLHDLGRPAKAAEVLVPEFDRIPASAFRARARYGARLALALASQRQLDHACAVAEQTIAAAQLVDSATVRVDLRLLRRTLGRWRDAPEVRRTNQGLTAVLHVGGN